MTINAKIIADSVNPDGVRITTLQLKYPKFINGEFNMHRTFSRNHSSSRAIPVERLIQEIIDDPVIPAFWGANQKGMSAVVETDAPVTVDLKTWVLNPTSDDEGKKWNNHPFYNPRTFTRLEAWLEARDAAIETARGYAKAGYHKQIVNRLLEPWYHINTVVTSTEWENFFKLRCHPDAQPEMRALAEAMRDAIDTTIPIPLNWGWWHLPYITPELSCVGDPNDIKSSVARCARVSYLTHDQKQTTMEEDLKLFERLANFDPKHLSPTEHQAQALQFQVEPMGKPASNFHPSWLQFRRIVEQQ